MNQYATNLFIEKLTSSCDETYIRLCEGIVDSMNENLPYEDDYFLVVPNLNSVRVIMKNIPNKYIPLSYKVVDYIERVIIFKTKFS